MSEFTGKTYYEILGVATDATRDDIRAAFRKASRKYHPDANGGTDEAQELSLEIGRIGNVLMNEASRIKYNQEIGLDADGHPFTMGDEPDDELEETEDAYVPFERPTTSRPTTSRPTTSRPTSTSFTQNSTQAHPDEEFDPFSINPHDLVDNTKMSWVKKEFPQEEKVTLPHPGMKQTFLYSAALFGALLVSFALVAMSSTWLLPKVLPLLALVVNAFFAVMWFIRERPARVNYAVSTVGTAAVLGWATFFTDNSNPLEVWRSLLVALLVGSTLLTGLKMEAAATVKRYIHSNRGTLMKSKDLKEFHVWGTPGRVGSADVFNERDKELGALGEQYTAELVKQLLNIPGTKIFHCLKFPSENPDSKADVDHAIVNGNKVALIDSKMWRGAKYAWEGDDKVKRVVPGRERFAQAFPTEFPFAVKAYTNGAFYEGDVRGWMTIYSNDGIRVQVDNTEAGQVRLATPQRMIEEIGAWFTEDESTLGTINRGLVSTVWSKTKA